MPKKKQNEYRNRELLIILWGILVAFAVQVFYDSFDSSLFTSIMPKALCGIMIAAVFGICTLLYFYLYLPSRKNKSDKEEDSPGPRASQ